MENSENSNEKYLGLYVKKQELLLMEYIRKSIDLDIRSTVLGASLQEMTNNFEEAKRNIEVLNDQLEQAVSGIDGLTVDKRKAAEKETIYLEKIAKIEKDLEQYINQNNKLNEELATVKETINNYKKESEESRRELSKQTEELNTLYKENQELIKKVPKK